MNPVTKPKRGRRPNEANRHRRQEEILDAAARLFAERGFADANTQVLADTLGVGKGTIYRYFPTKQDLFLAAVDRVMRQLQAAVDRAIEGIEEPLDSMARAMRAYLAFFAEHSAYVELIIQERAQFKDRKKPTYFVYREANVGRWRDVFRSLIAQGRVRNVPVERITEVVGDLLYGTMFANYFSGRDRLPQEQAEDILNIAFYGIFSDAERQKRQPPASAGDRDHLETRSLPHGGEGSTCK